MSGGMGLMGPKVFTIPWLLTVLWILLLRETSAAQQCGNTVCQSNLDCRKVYRCTKSSNCTISDECVSPNLVLRGGEDSVCPGSIKPVIDVVSVMLYKVMTCSGHGTNGGCPNGLICSTSGTGFSCCAQSVPEPFSAKILDPVDCPPTCRIGCKYGFETDAMNCPVCECRDPCRTVTCAGGTECQVLGTNSCSGLVCSNLTAACMARTANDCPQMKCSEYCAHGYETDARGCGTCICKDPCQYVTCPVGQRCEVPQKCSGLSCEGAHMCLDIVKPSCSPVQCRMFCTFGRRLDANGCEACACADDPCVGKLCLDGLACKVESSDCDTRTCYNATCVDARQLNPTQCNPVSCRIHCPFGWQKDADGCDFCSCKEPKNCAEATCPSGQVCQMQNTGSGSVPVCVANPSCAPVSCRIHCDNGWQVGEDGCEICACKETANKPLTCSDISCLQDQECQMIQVQCITTPCNPVPECVPKTVCPPVMCRMGCPYGWAKDTNGCDMCYCADKPTCVGVQCAAGLECRIDNIKAICAAPCPRAQCRMFCEGGFAKDSNGCDTCTCKDETCASKNCLFPQVCGMTNTSCGQASCPLVPVCLDLPGFPQTEKPATTTTTTPRPTTTTPRPTTTTPRPTTTTPRPTTTTPQPTTTTTKTTTTTTTPTTTTTTPAQNAQGRSKSGTCPKTEWVDWLNRQRCSAEGSDSECSGLEKCCKSWFIGLYVCKQPIIERSLSSERTALCNVMLDIFKTLMGNEAAAIKQLQSTGIC